MAGADIFSMVGRQEIVDRVLDRLRRPDDVRNSPSSFIRPGFYGVAGIGKTRLLQEIVCRAADVTPYVVCINFDARLSSKVPGTVPELLRYLIATLEQQDLGSRPFWRRRKIFADCWRCLEDLRLHIEQPQRIESHGSHLQNVTQRINFYFDGLFSQSVAGPLNDAVRKLHVKAEVQRVYGSLGKPKPRPLVLIVMDTLELVPRPIRAWLASLPQLFVRYNTREFHVMCLFAGRNQEEGLLDTPLSPLDGQMAAAFVRSYVATQRKQRPWMMRRPLTDGNIEEIVVQGQGIPLLLQVLAESVLLNPQVRSKSSDLPEAHDERFHYVLTSYIERLRAVAEGRAATDRKSSEEFWLDYFLLTYGSVPRRVSDVGLLRELLRDLPGTGDHFGPDANYEQLLRRLERWPFAEHLPGGGLAFHSLVRASASEYLREQDHDQWMRLQRRAAVHFGTRGNLPEYFYHTLQCDYETSITKLRNRIEQALEGERWSEVQELIDVTAHLPLLKDARDWITLYKADLAWAEGNPALAMERLRRLYGSAVPSNVRHAVAERLACWLSLDQITKSEKLDDWLELPAAEYLRDLLWWVEQRHLPELECRVVWELGCLAMMRGRYEEAGMLLDRALELYKKLGNRPGQANTLLKLGQLAMMRDRYEEAGKLLGRALELYEELDDRRGQAHSLRGLGELAMMRDRYEEGGKLLARALELCEELDDRRGQAHSLFALGRLARLRGRYEEAGKLLGRALELYEELDDRLGQANTLLELGRLARLRGRYEEAGKLLGRALELYEELDDRLGQANSLLLLGRLAMSRDRYEEGGKLLARALELCEELDDRRGQANSLFALGSLARIQRRYEEGGKLLARALELYEKLDARRGQANSLVELGHLAMTRGRYEEVGKLLDASTALCLEIEMGIYSASTQLPVIWKLVDKCRADRGRENWLAAYELAVHLLDQAEGILSSGECPSDRSASLYTELVRLRVVLEEISDSQ